jgi:hypothetical protein
MRILFVVNNVDTEVDRAATTVLATAACRRGPRGLHGRASGSWSTSRTAGSAPRRPGRAPEVESQQAFLDAVQGR